MIYPAENGCAGGVHSMTLRDVISRTFHHARARLRDVSTPTTTYRGVRFRHRGVLINQPELARHLDDVIGEVPPGVFSADVIAAVLRTIEVFVLPSPDQPKKVWAGAEWSGGFVEIGYVWVYAHPGWERIAAKAIRTLVMSAVSPGSVPEAPGTWSSDFSEKAP